jgi:tyrosine-protein phosphatase YwqE
VIDLHCRILDAIDDGARDADDSVGMARQAEEDGIEAVCATPHIRHDHDVRIEELAEPVQGLNARARAPSADRPPRAPPSADMFERMAALVAEGALIQATADFFLREQMAVGMLAMAEKGLVHVLSSDAHTVRAGRPVRLSPELREVELLASHLNWIAETAPKAIVNGEPLEVPFEPQV